MHLKTRAARFQHHAVLDELKFIKSCDVEIQIIAPQLLNRAIEFGVAQARSQVIERQIRWANGRKDAGEQHVPAEFFSALLRDGKHLGQILVPASVNSVPQTFAGQDWLPD